MANIKVQLSPDAAITEIDEALLVKTVGEFEDANERTTWTEYRLASDPNAQRAVHRSVDIVLKRPAVFADGTAQSFG